MAHAGYPSAQLDLGSDAVVRGLSQNNGLSYALRGDYGFDSRAYVGARAANNRSAGDAELDFYGGYAKTLSFRQLIPYSVDIGVSASVFTGDRDGPRHQNLDYAEAYAGIGVGPAALKFSASPDFYNEGGAGYRAAGTLKLPLTSSLQWIGVLGWNGGDGLRRYVASRRDDRRPRSYGDYSATLVQQLPHDFSAYVQVAGASIDIDGRAAPRVLVGVRKAFDF